MRLFCFTYAGGNASFYEELKKELDTKNIEIITFEYPGHGMRRKEHFADNIDELSEDMIGLMRNYLDNESYAVMGYSMGSIVATEVARKVLADDTFKNPLHIFMAAHKPKTIVPLSEIDNDKQDEYLRKRMVSFGTVPEELVNNETFWRFYMPLYKADYKLISQYKFEELELRTDIPTTIFYSEKDTPYQEMTNWKKYYVGDTQYFQFDGNHFFIKNHAGEMADVIYRRLFEEHYNAV